MLEAVEYPPVSAEDVASGHSARSLAVQGEEMGSGTAGQNKVCPPEYAAYQVRRKELSLYRDCLLGGWGNRVTLPDELRRHRDHVRRAWKSAPPDTTDPHFQFPVTRLPVRETAMPADDGPTLTVHDSAEACRRFTRTRRLVLRYVIDC
ncbi:hypothetical protein MRX96_034516 [Rhipicephalus microplus]